MNKYEQGGMKHDKRTSNNCLQNKRMRSIDCACISKVHGSSRGNTNMRSPQLSSVWRSVATPGTPLIKWPMRRDNDKHIVPEAHQRRQLCFSSFAVTLALHKHLTKLGIDCMKQMSRADATTHEQTHA